MDMSLQQILSNLTAIANGVRTNPDICQNIKQQLTEYGYDWFGNISNERVVKEQVMKVLAVAVNEAIQKKVDFKVDLVSLGHSDVVNQELCQLLAIDIHEDKSLEDYFCHPPLNIWSLIDTLVVAESPPDMAEYLKRNAPQWLVKNIIQYQFHMRWNTETGEPADYTFYQFCDKANTTQFFKYKPRQAHVKAMLYKECRKIRAAYYQRSITKEKLCPKVYIRTTRGWISWQADGHGENKCDDVYIENDLSWIDPSIRKFITENADKQKVESLQSLEDSLAKPTLYWAVLEDKDFVPETKLKLKPIGKTQVYVGKANNGIRGRWIKDKDNHCEKMKKCLDNVCAMTTYDPSTLEGIQLVDARLALAKVKRDHVKEYRLMKSGDDFSENSALFVIKTFGDDVEKAEIVQQRARERLDEAKRDVDRATASSRTQTTYPCITPGPVTMPYQYNPAGSFTMPPQYNPAGPVTMQPQYNPPGSFTIPPQHIPAGSFTMPPQYIPPVYPTMPQTSPLNTTSSRESSRLQELEAEVEKRQEELNEATAVVNDPKTLTISKEEAETQLKQAEKQHRKGKRVHEPWKNIIPYKDYKISWKPTDMRYGMNCN